MADLGKTNLWGDHSAETVELDENVISAIPNAGQASRIHAAGHGASYWTNTACVELEFSNGREKKYFLKIAAGDRGRGMMEGEFESMKVIHATTPDFVPEPIAWGTYKSNPELHFFLCDFREMDNELPEVNRFAENLAKLHRNSSSPTGKFGFHVTTYNGNIPQDVRWVDTWEECFVLGTKLDFELETAARGKSIELEALKIPLFEKVIPRLLRPLETGGRKLKPCFVHGDLWYGNTSNDILSEEPLVFDAAGFYGHNESIILAFPTWKRLSSDGTGQILDSLGYALVPSSMPLHTVADAAPKSRVPAEERTGEWSNGQWERVQPLFQALLPARTWGIADHDFIRERVLLWLYSKVSFNYHLASQNDSRCWRDIRALQASGHISGERAQNAKKFLRDSMTKHTELLQIAKMTLDEALERAVDQAELAIWQKKVDVVLLYQKNRIDMVLKNIDEGGNS